MLEPTAALEWITRSKPEEGRQRAFDAAYRRWALRDSTAATEWIANAERTSDLDLAVLAHAHGQLEAKDPHLALKTCGEILEGELRETCHVGIAKGWLRRNRAAALQWIESTDDLGEDARTALRREARKRRGRGRRNASAKEAVGP